MPSFFSDALNEVRTSMEVPTPPAFAPIAAILLPNSYKSDLSRLIKSAPDDLLENKEWWFQLTKLTKTRLSDVKKIHGQAKQAVSQRRANALDTFEKLLAMPEVSKDKTMSKMGRTFINRTRGGKAEIEDIIKMQKVLATRLAKMDERLAKMRTNRERLNRSTKPTQEGVEEPITEAMVVENMLGDVVSKMAKYFASPQLTRAMAGPSADKKMNQQLARASVYSLLQMISERAYAKLEQAGLNRRVLLKAHQNRNKAGNSQILNRAAKILGTDRRFGAPPKKGEAGSEFGEIKIPAGARAAKSRTEPPPAPRRPKQANEADAAVAVPPLQENDPLPDAPEQPEVQEKPKEKPEELSVGAQIYRKVMAAATSAKEQGQDPAAVADYILKQYEEQKIPDAAIVRRMFERSKLRNS